jgi:hypothetical protein
MDVLEGILADNEFLSDDAPAASDATPRPMNPTSTTSVPSAPLPDAVGEGRPLEEIYTLARVPSSAFPAEKLLRVLDGLKAMDPNTRKVAVMAMDAADDAWSIEDSILDAQRKTQALESAAASLVEQVRQAEAQAQIDLQSQDAYQGQATDSIRKQIEELEILLREELQKVAQEKAAVESKVAAARESCERETARFRQEIERLQEISKVFSSPGV